MSAKLLCILLAALGVNAKEQELLCDCQIVPSNAQRVQLQCRKANSSSPITCSTGVETHVDRGYRYLPGFGVYRLNRAGRDWWTALEACKAEGAHVAVPETRAEADALRSLMPSTGAAHPAWIGYSDDDSKGTFHSVLGVPLKKAEYQTWNPGEPRIYTDENCIFMNVTGDLSAYDCELQMPFFCEKPFAKTIPAGYAYFEGLGFYKMYDDEEITYEDARKKCQQDGGHLAIPESEHEMEALLALINSSSGENPWVGINDISEEGTFVTEKGKLVKRNPYHYWVPYEPDNYEDKEDCVVIHFLGGFQDEDCSDERPFICEIELE